MFGEGSETIEPQKRRCLKRQVSHRAAADAAAVGVPPARELSPHSSSVPLSLPSSIEPVYVLAMKIAGFSCIFLRSYCFCKKI